MVFNKKEYQKKYYLKNREIILNNQKNNFCIDCGEKICKVYKRCKKCSNTPKTREKRSNAKIGEKNPMWKGNEVGYNSLHTWIRKHKPKPSFCEICEKNEPYDLANISGEYKRDINDFEWICRKCHMKKDERLMELIKLNKKRKISKEEKKRRKKEYYIKNKDNPEYKLKQKKYQKEYYQKNKERIKEKYHREKLKEN